MTRMTALMRSSQMVARCQPLVLSHVQSRQWVESGRAGAMIGASGCSFS